MSALKALWRPIDELKDGLDGFAILTDARLALGHVTLAEYDPPTGAFTEKAVREGFVWRTPEGLFDKAAFTHFIPVTDEDLPEMGEGA